MSLGGLSRQDELRQEAIDAARDLAAGDEALVVVLRDLEREGLIIRIVHSEMPAHVEYRISPHGESVKPLIEAVRAWGRDHLDRANQHGEAPALGDASLPATAQISGT